MRGPDEISDALGEIRSAGLLRICAAGSSGDAEACAVEADHLHNVPELLGRYRPELLRYYWDVERAAFLRQCGGVGTEVFEGSWRRLERCLPELEPAEVAPAKAERERRAGVTSHHG